MAQKSVKTTNGRCPDPGRSARHSFLPTVKVGYARRFGALRDVEQAHRRR
jgi:hypothetical protein